jgi:hypothetical protein
MEAIEKAAGVQAGKYIATPPPTAKGIRLTDPVRAAIDEAIQQMRRRSQELASIRSSTGPENKDMKPTRTRASAQCAGSPQIGNITVNRLPRPGTLSTSILPSRA